jgi:glycosyltransferase involved in cell wall biosynthesis
MNGCPLVSVVIPVYNRAHLLGRAIRSVLAQTFQNLELVVVDDGSTDGSAGAVAPFEDPRIRVIRLPRNRGVSRARNIGIQDARGHLVAFLDSDDEWLPDKLERQVARFREHPAEDKALVSCRFIRYDDLTHRTATPTRPILPGDAFDQLVQGQAPLPSCVMIPRPVLVAVGGLDEALAAFADYELWLRLADAATCFVEIGDVLVIKHEHGTRQISGDPEMMLDAFRTLDQKWGARIQQRSGRSTYRRWQAGFLASVQYVRVRRAIARADRAAAWRHWLHLCRYAARSPRYAVYGLGLATLGLHGYDALARIKDRVARKLGRR